MDLVYLVHPEQPNREGSPSSSSSPLTTTTPLCTTDEPYAQERTHLLSSSTSAAIDGSSLLLPLVHQYRDRPIPVSLLHRAAEFIGVHWEQQEVQPMPRLVQFLLALHRRIPSNLITFLISLLYLDRLKTAFPLSRGQGGCGHRLAFVSYLVAARWLHDPDVIHWDHPVWSMISGPSFTIQEIDTMENEFRGFLYAATEDGLCVSFSQFLGFLVSNDLTLAFQIVPGSEHYQRKAFLWFPGLWQASSPEKAYENLYILEDLSMDANVPTLHH